MSRLIGWSNTYNAKEQRCYVQLKYIYLPPLQIVSAIGVHVCLSARCSGGWRELASYTNDSLSRKDICVARKA